MTQQNQPFNGLSLWEEVQTTDPAFTRSFQRSSGFGGTAINPTYLVRRATEKFGPMGLDWGVKVLEESLTDGHVIGFPADGGPPIRCQIHSMKVEVWYMLDGRRGSVEQYGCTTFVGKTSDGTIYTNEDCKKMSQTDGMTKCLSLLGFGGDVHIGLYDDSKYVADLEAAFSQGVLPKARNTAASQDVATARELKPGNGNQSSEADGRGKSSRYESYKKRFLTLKPEEKAAALAGIEKDDQLSDMERAQLRTALQSDDVKPKGKGANEVEQTFL